MAIEKTVETRSDIQRMLDRFTRAEIDFQALLAALDQVFLTDPGARRVALELVERQQPNGALQRSFFRVLKERIEQQLGSSAPPPRAGRRAMADRNRAAPPAASAGARSDATRPFGARPGSAVERAHPDATRPLDLSPPPDEDERTPHETTLPFTARAPLSEGRSPDATRPLTSPEPPPLEISPADARLAFRSPSPGAEIAPPESTPPSTPQSSRDERASTASASDDATRPLEATQASEPLPARDEPSPSETKEPASAASEPREERFVARRRSSVGFGRGRYANRGWAATGREEVKEPVSPPPPVERSEQAAIPDVEPAAATMPPDFDVGVPIADTRTGATAESGLDTSAPDPTPTRPPEEPRVPRRSESGAPAPEDEDAVAGTMRASGEPAAAEEPAAAPREPVEPVRSAPPPRSPFSRRRQPLPPPRAEEPEMPNSEHPFVTERRTIEPPRQQPLALVGGVLVILLLFALVFLGPLKEYVPGVAAFLQRDVPEAFRKVVPAPESEQEVTPPTAGESPPAAAPEEAPGATPGAAGVPGTAPPSAPKRADASGKPVAAGATDPRTVTGGSGSPGAATPTGSTNATSPRSSTAPAAGTAASAGATPPKAATPNVGASTPPKAATPDVDTSTPPKAQAATPKAGASTPPKPATTAAAAPSKTVTPGAVATAPAKAAPAKAAAPASFPAGRFAFASRSYSGRESGMVPIRIQRRGGTAGTASVAWSTRAESAEPGNDYADFGIRVEEFADGEREKVIYVPIADDDVAEPRESFGVQLENPSEGATLDTVSDVTVTILDDDN